MKWFWQKTPSAPPAPFDETDVWSVIERLSPIARTFVDTPDVRVSFWADRSVYIHLRMHSGSEMSGRGASLAEAVESLRSQSRIIERVLSPTDGTERATTKGQDPHLLPAKEGE